MEAYEQLDMAIGIKDLCRGEGDLVGENEGSKVDS